MLLKMINIESMDLFDIVEPPLERDIKSSSTMRRILSPSNLDSGSIVGFDFCLAVINIYITS